jgi:hypothetical protein
MSSETEVKSQRTRTGHLGAWALWIGLTGAGGFVMGVGGGQATQAVIKQNPYKIAAIQSKASEDALEAEYAAFEPKNTDSPEHVAWRMKLNAAETVKLNAILRQLSPPQVINQASDLFDVVRLGSPSEIHYIPFTPPRLIFTITIRPKQTISRQTRIPFDGADDTGAVLGSDKAELSEVFDSDLAAGTSYAIRFEVPWPYPHLDQCALDRIVIRKPDKN